MNFSACAKPMPSARKRTKKLREGKISLGLDLLGEKRVDHGGVSVVTSRKRRFDDKNLGALLMAGSSFEFDMGALTKAVEGLAGRMKRFCRALPRTWAKTLVFLDPGTLPQGRGPGRQCMAPCPKEPKKKAARLWSIRVSCKNSIVYEASPQMVVVGSDKVYARIHQKRRQGRTRTAR